MLSNVTNATANGNFNASACTNVQFTMPEFSNKNTLDMQFNTTDEHSLPYYMTLGKDVL